MSISSLDDENEVIIRFKSGDTAVLEYIITKYQREMLFFAKNIVQSMETAEEIVDDSFLKVWNKRERFENLQDLKSFLYVIIRNACLDFLKSPRNNRDHAEIDSVLSLADDKNFESQLIYNELLSAIYQEVCLLPEKQKQVFLLSFFEELSTTEIMERLGISSNAVFIHKHEASKAIRQIFKKNNPFFYILFLYYFN